MAFMFETRFPQHLTRFAAHEAPLQDDYVDCWAGLEKKFDGTPEPSVLGVSPCQSFT
jgi:homogentisate 1,2-dioxygenase